MKTVSEQSASIKDLRKHLFHQIDRLNDPKADLSLELQRAKALSGLGTVIVNSVKMEIDYLKLTKPRGKKQIENE